MSTFKHKDLNVVIHVKARQKHSYLRIKDKSVHISTPYKRHAFYIEFIESRLEWIYEQLQTSLHVEITSEIILYGNIVKNPQTLQNSIDKKPLKAESFQDAFHKQETILHVEKFYARYSIQMNLFGSTISYRKMKRRWGSCNSKAELTFNSLLSRLPVELIEYVVVHELSHLKHMNHSKAFHLHVKRYLSNEKELRARFSAYKVL